MTCRILVRGIRKPAGINLSTVTHPRKQVLQFPDFPAHQRDVTLPQKKNNHRTPRSYTVLPNPRAILGRQKTRQAHQGPKPVLTIQGIPLSGQINVRFKLLSQGPVGPPTNL